MHINKFLGTFGRQSVKYYPESVAAQISPDCSWCLIRMPWSRNNRVTTLQVGCQTQLFTGNRPLEPKSGPTTPTDFLNRELIKAPSSQMQTAPNSYLRAMGRKHTEPAILA
ncbi:unnamed protein product [Dibothriocephalus latus]|uniref:Uncharacterized protein n=1 Tax=Dibothriocephalus latus TaxID=60516 RepID=A0A3P6TGY9_DIBLA|nr:unnamed protein product [Dibothriocephalus latus]